MAQKKKVIVEDLEEEEEDVEEELPKAKVVASAAKASKNGTAPAKRMPPQRTGPSARDYVTKVLLKGAPRNEVKKRASALAKKDGADVSFKTFDVSYFIKYLRETKGYKIRESDDGMVKATAPAE
jgi:hypothetical protein